MGCTMCSHTWKQRSQKGATKLEEERAPRVSRVRLGEGGQREKESQAHSLLGMEPDAGLDSTTLRP